MTFCTLSRTRPTNYSDDLEARIIKEVQGGVQNLWQLVMALPGHYPTVVRDAVARLIEKSAIPSHIADEDLEPGLESQSQLEIAGLPVPHPLDFDWRFTEETAVRLLEKLARLCRPRNLVALLGTPSVHMLANRRGIADRFVLFDGNHSLADNPTSSLPREGVYLCDLLGDVPNLPSFQAVLADPPWYVEQAAGFLRFASQICDTGGTILLSFAPEGAKPEIADQRQRIIAEAGRVGLSFSGSEHLALSYATPFFERNALRSAGFGQVASAWRRGDLLVFRKVRNLYSQRIHVDVQSSAWEEVSIAGVRFRVRKHNQEGFSDPRLKELVPGDILPSVSRTDERRKEVEVWSSGNRVYRCDGTHILASILRAMRESEDPVTSVQQEVRHQMDGVETKLVEFSASQIEQIVRIERREVGSSAGGLR